MIRRLTFLVVLLLAFAAPALATDITVSSFQAQSGAYHWGGATAKIRIYANMSWTDSSGVPHAAGTAGSQTGWFQEIDCTIVSNTLNIPSFTISSTTNAIVNRQVRLTAVIFDYRGNAHEHLFDNWFIPYQLNPTSWAVLVVDNAATQKPLADTYDTSARVDAKIAAAIGGGIAVATDSIQGKLTIDVPASDPAHPVAVGINSPLLGTGTGTGVTTNMQCAGINDSTAFLAAIAAGGTIQIAKGVTCAADSTVNFPETVTLKITKGGLLKPVTGQTPVITGYLEAGIYQIFTNANAGQGTVGNATTAIDKVYPQWWGAFPSNSGANNNAPLQAFFNFTGVGKVNGTGTNNRAGVITGNFHITAAISLAHFIGYSLTGANKLYSGFTQETANTKLFDGNHIAYGTFDNLSFTTTASQNVGMIDLYSTDGSDLAPQNIRFNNCVFAGSGLGYVGIWIARTGGGSQGDSISAENSVFTGFTESAIQLGGGPGTDYAQNAIHVGVRNCDFQGNTKHAVAAYGGSFVMESILLEDGNWTSASGLTQTACELYSEASQNLNSIKNFRSESVYLACGGWKISDGSILGPQTTFISPWTGLPGTGAFTHQLVTGTPYGGDGKMYEVTSTPTFSVTYTVITTPFDATTITDSANTYVVNAYAGQLMQVKYPNCYEGQFRTILSNTAHTFTLASALDYTPADTAADLCGTHTQFRVISSFPTFGGLQDQTATSGSSTTIVKSSATWTNDQFAGMRATILSGTGKYEYGIVTANTNTTITVAAGWVSDYQRQSSGLPVLIVSPDSSSHFVVEPNWNGGTVTSGTVTMAAFNYNVVDGCDQSVCGANNPGYFDISNFTAGYGGRANMVGRVVESSFTRADWVYPHFQMDSSVPSLPNRDVVVVRPGAVTGEYVPWFITSNNGYASPADTTQDLRGRQWINFKFGDDIGVTYPVVGIGPGGGIAYNDASATSLNILGIRGMLGRETSYGTNLNGAAMQIQGGLATGSGTGGKVEIWCPPAAGGSGSAVRPGTRCAYFDYTRLQLESGLQLVSTIATGTPPFVVASTTNIPNLNASSLNGATFAAPGPIGGGTPAAITGTSLTITGTPISSSSTMLLGAPMFLSTGGITTATIGTSAATYLTPGNTTGGGESFRQTPMSACVVRNLRVNLAATSPAAGTVVITVRKNGVDTAITITISAGTTTAVLSDFTHSVTFASNEKLSISVTNNDASNTFAITGTVITLEAVRQ